MKRIQIQKTVLLSLLFSSALFADIHDRIEYKLSRVLNDVEGLIINGSTSSSCTQITQANFVNGLYTINVSGEYCVAEDLVGEIVIAVDSVCIDLQCHIVAAGLNATVFNVNSHSGIRISNGTIANAGDAGILAVGSAAVELSNLYFVGNDNDAIRLDTCTEVYVHNVSAFGGAGNRAVALINCNNAVIENCEMTGYTSSTAAGIIDILSLCECVWVRNVDVCDCIFGSSPAFCGGIHVSDSINVVIEHSRVHRMSGSGEAETNGILIDTCFDCKVIGSQTNGNEVSGIKLIGDNINIAIIECVAMGNINSGIDFDASGTATCCLVQDCRALNNVVYGFSHAPGSLETTFIGNEAECNGSSDYNIIGGAIGLQGLSWISGNLIVLSGNAALGARFTNITAGFFGG